MLVYSPFYLLLLVFLAFLIPGAILALGLLKGKKLALFDKVGIGFALGLIGPPFICFLLFLIGVKFSFTIALLSIALFYIVSIAACFYRKGWEELSFPSDYKKMIPSAALALIMLLAFWIRLQSYSPIFMELDPYYYIYHDVQILTEGGGLLVDYTAWYPEVEAGHRAAPLKAYMESISYTLYTGGGEFERYMLSVLAGTFPPILAALAVFFVALLISSEYRREFGIIAAGVAAFIPMFILKLAAGESEIQPYAFFALAFFFAMYALAVKRRDPLFGALAGISYLTIELGSSSSIVAVTALLIFIPLQAIVKFFMREEERKFALVNGLVILIGPILSTILGGIFRETLSFSSFFSGYNIALLGVYAFSIAIMLIQERVKDVETGTYALGALLIAGMLVFAFTPIGSSISGIAVSGMSIAKYNKPLDRTIAEQGGASQSFENIMGFIGMDFEDTTDQAHPFDPISLSVNASLSVLTGILNGLFGVGIVYNDKANSMLLWIFFFTILSIAYSLYRKFKFKEWRIPLLFLALIFPISIVGLLKTKYSIYLAFVTAIALGVVLGEIYDFATHRLERIANAEKRKKYLNYIFSALLILGAIFVFMEFGGPSSMGEAILLTSFTTRFQDDPVALQPKMQEYCDQFGGTLECMAASDPVGFASQSIIYQYNPYLCSLSIPKDPRNPTVAESIAMNFRCLTIDYYWIDLYEWVISGTPEDARFMSWWDYGHWTNYFGQRDTVLRNEHSSHSMITGGAYAFVYGEPEEMISYMRKHGSEYLIIDQEIVGQRTSSGSLSFGGKFSALNYLSCAGANKTDVNKAPYSSRCEAEHLWEQVSVPGPNAPYQECTISPLTGKTGVIVYYMEPVITGGRISHSPKPIYCLGMAVYADGEERPALYSMGETHKTGELKLHKALLNFDYSTPDGYNIYTLLYTKDKVWLENGEVKSGWEDRKSEFYDSVLYQGFVLKDLPGFELVYTTPGEEIKLYKIKEGA